ncbi:MAG: L,D-transpeptidase family protein [Negativicutes bacterium]|nr:L,D-transpeptidase family protein [Negativicutes bacterium]
MAVLVSVPVLAQQNPDLSSPSIVINLPSRTLEFYAGTQLIKEYPIAVGKPSTPSPLGEFYIMNKEVNPAWYPPRSNIVIPSGPDNPLGYRWMGFLPMYGIHGTNAPWAIGGAVSNGCIRMHEQDVEELFELVPYGTPVRVTYDRVRVRIDSKGQVSVGVYPDIYGYQDVSLADIKAKLEAYSLAGLASEEFLRKQIQEEPDRQVVFAQLVKLRVNDQHLVEPAVLQDENLLVPVWAVAGALKRNITWDEQVQLVRSEKRTVAGKVKGDILYVSADDIQVLFGGQKVWRPEENTLEINVLTVFINNKLLTRDVQTVDGVLAIPLLPLSEATGQKIIWDPVKRTALLYGKHLPVSAIDGQPYIKITQVYEHFRAYVYWNEKAKTIELTYPFKVEGGSD